MKFIDQFITLELNEDLASDSLNSVDNHVINCSLNQMSYFSKLPYVLLITTSKMFKFDAFPRL